MDEREHGVAFFPAVFACEPSGGLGEEDHSDEEEHSWYHLHTPGDTEGGGALDVAAAVGDATLNVNTVIERDGGVDVLEHDHDTPGDGPLLHADKTTTLGGGSLWG